MRTSFLRPTAGASIALLLLAGVIGPVASLHAGDNSEVPNGDQEPPFGVLFDKFWDKRYYDGTFNTAIPWHHDPDDKPEAVGSANFVSAVTAAGYGNELQ